LTSTRILTRRRLGAHGVPHAPVVVRRRRTRGFVQVASAVTAERLRLNTFGHAYLGLGAILIAVLFYLALAAQVTQSSYQITQLQDQQRQLLAEQDQLRYQEATLQAPAQEQQQAAQNGMQRVPPSNLVPGQAVAIDLQAPIGAPPADQTPLWERALAALVSKLGVTHDAMAATH
jgi:Tfp pilus assembly protein PilN